MTMTKADQSFRRKLQHELRDGRAKPDPGPVMAASKEAAEAFRRELETPLPLNTEAVSTLFGQYGTYLELVGSDEPEGETRVFEWPARESQA